MKELRDYEVKNNLPNFMSTEHGGGLYYSKGKYPQKLTFEGLQKADFSKSLFSEATADIFPKENK